jgi:hypothetical protein
MVKKETAKKVKVASKSKATKVAINKLGKAESKKLEEAKQIILEQRDGVVLVAPSEKFENEGGKGVNIGAMFVKTGVPDGAITDLFDKLSKEIGAEKKSKSPCKGFEDFMNKVEPMVEGLAMIEEADRVESKMYKVMALMIVSLIATIVLDTMFGFFVALTAHIIMLGSFIWAISLDRKLAYLNGHIEGLHKGTKVMLNK